mmetsp:Transcript_16432/g.35995  ORF Transcript_16432/g.35995 Transcript_16432/m.35995 type:complete len:380 (+) Transcript_16432:694-1833(+)
MRPRHVGSSEPKHATLSTTPREEFCPVGLPHQCRAMLLAGRAAQDVVGRQHLHRDRLVPRCGGPELTRGAFPPCPKLVREGDGEAVLIASGHLLHHAIAEAKSPGDPDVLVGSAQPELAVGVRAPDIEAPPVGECHGVHGSQRELLDLPRCLGLAPCDSAQCSNLFTSSSLRLVKKAALDCVESRKGVVVPQVEKCWIVHVFRLAITKTPIRADAPCHHVAVLQQRDVVEHPRGNLRYWRNCEDLRIHECPRRQETGVVALRHDSCGCSTATRIDLRRDLGRVRNTPNVLQEDRVEASKCDLPDKHHLSFELSEVIEGINSLRDEHVHLIVQAEPPVGATAPHQHRSVFVYGAAVSLASIYVGHLVEDGRDVGRLRFGI